MDVFILAYLLIKRKDDFKMNEEKEQNKEYYKDKIIQMLNEINNTNIMRYIYIIVLDILKEDH